MRLLILTQKVDQNDDVLGFFHGWIAEFAKHCEQVTVIALGVGEYDLPNNVRVFSLGKERGASRLKYLLNFYRLIWRERKTYDTVFVHMNQEYVVLGGLLWKLLGKKITMWRNHPLGNVFTRVSAMLSHVVFCTSPYSYTARFSKTISNMPVGIDINIFFDKGESREPDSILSIGRISPIKNIFGVIEMTHGLKEKGWNGNAYVYGSAPLRDKAYEHNVHREARHLSEIGVVHFEKSVPFCEVPNIYNKYEVYVNLTKTGSFDKTVFEAMACGMMVLVSNQSFVGKIPDECICREGDAEDLIQKAQAYFRLSPEKKREIVVRLRSYVETEQSLQGLMDHLFGLLA